MNFDLTKLKAELRRDEGVKFAPYKDSLGNWTIGVGHLLPHDQPLPKFWSKVHVDKTLEADIQSAYDLVKNFTWYKSLDTDNRRRAIINMAFNLGSRLFTFKIFLNYLDHEQYRLAANDLNGTKWHEQVGERANRIIGLLRNG